MIIVLQLMMIMNISSGEVDYSTFAYPRQGQIVNSFDESTIDRLAKGKSGKLEHEINVIRTQNTYGYYGNDFICKIVTKTNDLEQEGNFIVCIKGNVTTAKRQNNGKWVVTNLNRLANNVTECTQLSGSPDITQYLATIYNIKPKRGFIFVDFATSADLSKYAKMPSRTLNEVIEHEYIGEYESSLLPQNKKCKQSVVIKVKSSTGSVVLYSAQATGEKYSKNVIRQYDYGMNNLYTNTKTECKHTYNANVIWNSKSNTTYNYTNWTDDELKKIIESIYHSDVESIVVVPWYLIISTVGALALVVAIVLTYTNKRK